MASETYDVGGKRDPFVPLVTGTRETVKGLYGVETVDDLTLEGVVLDPKSGSVAIVNGEIVREGEVRDNLKVIKIQSDGVLFEINEIEQFKALSSEN